jgi:hypothetical protein
MQALRVGNSAQCGGVAFGLIAFARLVLVSKLLGSVAVLDGTEIVCCAWQNDAQSMSAKGRLRDKIGLRVFMAFSAMKIEWTPRSSLGTQAAGTRRIACARKN